MALRPLPPLFAPCREIGYEVSCSAHRADAVGIGNSAWWPAVEHPGRPNLETTANHTPRNEGRPVGVLPYLAHSLTLRNIADAGVEVCPNTRGFFRADSPPSEGASASW